MTVDARQIETVAEGFAYLECPRWRDRQIYVSDFYQHRVITIDPVSGTATTVAEVPGQPSGLGWLPDGRLLVVSMKDRRIMRLDGDGLVEHADLSSHAPAHLNDMVVDAEGRAYVGNFGSDAPAGEPVRATNILRVDPDGRIHEVAQDMLGPNGMVITPDRGTLIVAESLAARLTAFDVDEQGGLYNRRVVAQLGTVPTVDDFPSAIGQMGCLVDGMTLDAEGACWVADAIGQRVLRVLDGEVVDVVDTSVVGLGTFACMLGGDDGRTLYMASAPSFVEDDCKAADLSKLLAVRVAVPHAGLP
jgi:sugar lactone lactonase YvrE